MYIRNLVVKLEVKVKTSVRSFLCYGLRLKRQKDTTKVCKFHISLFFSIITLRIFRQD